MQVRLNPYLNFGDQTRQAMEFYKSVFGGNLQMSTFKESNASQNPADDDKIMHAALEAGGITFMAADTPSGMDNRAGTNFALSLSGDDDEALRGYFEKLSEGGAVTMPLEKAPWGDIFGMLTDKFGIQWMVDIAPKS